MDKDELRARYEAYGDEGDYSASMPQYLAALAGAPDDPVLLNDDGYLQECHGRRAIPAAVGCHAGRSRPIPGTTSRTGC